MILQALYDYYQRKAADPESHIAPEGFQWQEIKFIIIIDENGRFVDLNDTRNEKGKGKLFLLPKAKKRSGSNACQTTFLLWDHYGYLLGHPKSNEKKSLEMAKKQHKVFINEIKNLPPIVKKDKGVNAVLAFYERSEEAAVKKHPNWKDCEKIPGCNLTFRLVGDAKLVSERTAIVKYQSSLLAESQETDNDSVEIIGRCLITGDRGPIARLHTATPILGSKSNATLVAFQKNSGYDSYGKEQAFNAPISIRAEAAYTTALKYLLSSTTNKQTISDATVIFWAEKRKIKDSYDLESNFVWFIADKKDDPDRGIQAVKSLYEAIHTGRLAYSDERFYVLGLAPNAARISVRFFRQGAVRDFGEKIIRHFDDFEIIRSPFDPEYLSLYRILTATALQYKMENVPPNLAGAVIESILDGTPYPTTLLHQCIRRIRADAARKDQNGKSIQNVTRTRAAILKAAINRFNRIHKQNEKEITMALDLKNNNPGYRLGRLFAVLEKIQEEGNPGINTTIRDRFYGAASTNPVAVFSQLLKLKNHHLAKLDNPGRRVNFEKLIGEIMSELSEFPPHLSLNDQAYFSIGYYHQRQDFFTSKKTEKENSRS